MDSFKTIEDILNNDDVSENDKHKLIKTYERLLNFYTIYKWMPLWNKIVLFDNDYCYTYFINIDKTLDYEKRITNYKRNILSSDYLLNMNEQEYIDNNDNISLNMNELNMNEQEYIDNNDNISLNIM